MDIDTEMKDYSQQTSEMFSQEDVNIIQEKGTEYGAKLLLNKDKLSVANFLKNLWTKNHHSDRSMGKLLLSEMLDILLNPCISLSSENNNTIEWLKFLIAGGCQPLDYYKIVEKFDDSTTCSLVWTADFMAYRCRTCGISPCMSLCLECFNNGDHTGHDYNMFKSQGGGACDCGNAAVMSPSGFCARHKESQTRPKATDAPDELFHISRIIIPRFLLSFILYCRSNGEAEGKLELQEVTKGCEHYVNLLQELCLRGGAMRNVLTSYFCSSEIYKRYTETTTKFSSYFENCKKIYDETLESIPFGDIPEGYEDITTLHGPLIHTSFIEEIVFWMLKFEFPQNIVCLLLNMRTNSEFEDAFARAFVQHYSRIPTMLLRTEDFEPLSQRVVHVSVQLFSDKNLALRMVNSHHLLQVVVLSIKRVLKTVLVPSTLHDVVENKHEVVDCSHEVMKNHSYWSLVSDLNNLLTHQPIAYKFMADSELLREWFSILSMFQGMNNNWREMKEHVEFEPQSYYASYSAEVEVSSIPLWAMLSHMKDEASQCYSLNVIKHCLIHLQNWLKLIGFYEWDKRYVNEATFHLPLHRNFALFLQQAAKKQAIKLRDVLPSNDLLAALMVHPLRAQVAYHEVSNKLWVRNGMQIQGQAMTYTLCHFCNGMFDADLFLLQIGAGELPKDSFILSIFDRFNVMRYLKLGKGSSKSGSFKMLEAALTFITFLTTNRNYLGLSDERVAEMELIALISTQDRTHSKLKEFIPERCINNTDVDFDVIVKKFMKHIGPDCQKSGEMREGIYIPRDFVWEEHYDPIFTLTRCIHKKDYETSLNRFKKYCCKSEKVSSNMSKKLWPPYRIPPPVADPYNDPRRVLCCRSFHAAVFTLLYKSLHDARFTENLSSLVVFLLELTVDFQSKMKESGLEVATTESAQDLSKKAVFVDGLFYFWFNSDDIFVNCCTVIDKMVVNSQNFSKSKDLSTRNSEIYNTDVECILNPNNLALSLASCDNLALPLAPCDNLALSLTSTNRSVSSHSLDLNSDYEGEFSTSPDALPLPAPEFTGTPMSLEENSNFSPQVRNASPHYTGDSLSPANFLMSRFPNNPVIPILSPENSLVSSDILARSISPGNSLATESSMIVAIPEQSNLVHHNIETMMIDVQDDFQSNDFPGFSGINSFPGSSQFPTTRSMISKEIIERGSNYNVEDSNQSPEGINSNKRFETTGEYQSVKESIITLLLKLHRKYSDGDEVYRPDFECDSDLRVGDGSFFIANLLNKIGRANQAARSHIYEATEQLFPRKEPEKSPPNPQEEECSQKIREEQRKKARDLQRKIMNSFSLKQQKFWAKNQENSVNSPESSGGQTKTAETQNESAQIRYECVICNQTIPTSLDRRPFGLIAFLQRTNIHGAQRPSPFGYYLPTTDRQSGKFRLEFFTKTKYMAKKMSSFVRNFDGDSCLLSMDNGYDVSVRVQTCGHHLHLDCHKAYTLSLRSQQRITETLADFHNGEYFCPLCRQLSNCVLPIFDDMNSSVAVEDYHENHEVQIDSAFGEIVSTDFNEMVLQSSRDFYKDVKRIFNESGKKIWPSRVQYFPLYHYPNYFVSADYYNQNLFSQQSLLNQEIFSQGQENQQELFTSSNQHNSFLNQQNLTISSNNQHTSSNQQNHCDSSSNQRNPTNSTNNQQNPSLNRRNPTIFSEPTSVIFHTSEFIQEFAFFSSLLRTNLEMGLIQRGNSLVNQMEEPKNRFSTIHLFRNLSFKARTINYEKNSKLIYNSKSRILKFIRQLWKSLCSSPTSKNYFKFSDTGSGPYLDASGSNLDASGSNLDASGSHSDVNIPDILTIGCNFDDSGSDVNANSSNSPATDSYNDVTGSDYPGSNSATTVAISNGVPKLRRKVPILYRDPITVLIHLLLFLPPRAIAKYFNCIALNVYRLVVVQSTLAALSSLSENTRRAALLQGPLAPLLGLVYNNTRGLFKPKNFSEPVAGSSTSESDKFTAVSADITCEIRESCLSFLRIAALLKSFFCGERIPIIADPLAECGTLERYLSLWDVCSVVNTEVMGEMCGILLSDHVFPQVLPTALTGPTAGFVETKMGNLSNVLKRWTAHLGISNHSCDLNSPRSEISFLNIMKFYRPKLLNLPRSFDEIFKYYHKKKCGQCNKLPKDPGVCLVCGTFVCMRHECCAECLTCGTFGGSHSECCKDKGAFEGVSHARKCGAGTSVFLAIFKAAVIVISGSRVCRWGSIHLDIYGEEDKDLKRGKPLYLSKGRYNLLEEQWINLNFTSVPHHKWVRHNNMV